MSTATYNGWANWETWNVALWIQNDYSTYKVARQYDSYNRLIPRPYRDWETDRKSTRLNSSHSAKSRMPSSA